MHIRPYSDTDANGWDQYCDSAVNATFLHTRRFLSYHGKRFQDTSCIIERDGEWLGILPAAVHPERADCIVSHPGISYGGLLHCGRLTGEGTVEAFDQVMQHFRNLGYRHFYYKAIPMIYPMIPAQDDLYALFRLGAEKYRCDLSSAIDLSHRLAPAERRLRALRKAAKAGIQVVEGIENLVEFWSVLVENLSQKHQAKPVHQIEEIQELCRRFPNNIHLHCATQSGVIVAGSLLFSTPRVLHCQYIAANHEGKESNALDAVFRNAIESAHGAARYFDFGISNELEGQVLNDGLYRFKTEFGGSGVVHEFFRLPLTTD